ncbi:TetR/AcrR family transcriptional regulator [Deltaproteobacteria bacterium]|nr:TetR/AcrR family transcriptional regulator [Deltaproteobacteria bacterium]
MAKIKKDSDTKDQNQLFPKDLVFASTKNALLVENRHQQIVDGACRLFLKKGYHPTTTREIAKACGMSIGQLYHYISCKDDVLYLVHKHTQKVWHEYLNKADLVQIDDPVQKLKKALYYSLEFMIDNRKLIQFIYSESKYLDKKYLRIVLKMDYNNVVGFWRNLLEEVNKTIPIKGDPDFLCSIISYLLAFFALRGWTLAEKQNQKHLDSLVSFILGGLGVSYC